MRTSTSPTGPEPPAAERGYRFPRSARLTHAFEFRRVYGRGMRASGKLLVVVAARRRDPGHRLGLAVSKEHGRAVRRNKLKRILREAFRLERPTLPGQFDLVLIPKAREGHLELDEVRRELVELLQKLDVRDEAPRRGRRRRRPS